MLKRLFFKHDWIVTTLTLLILLIGLVTIYSTSAGNAVVSRTATENAFGRQLVYAIAGIFIYLIISNIDYTYLKYRPVIGILYGLNIVLLILATIGGQDVRGTTRWITAGPINLQPSEIAKLVIILSISSFLINIKISNKDRNAHLKFILQSFLLITPLIFLVFMGRSLSSSVTLCIISFSIFFLDSKNPISFISVVSSLICAINLGSLLIMPQILFFPVVHGISLGIIIISLAIFIITFLIKKIETRYIIGLLFLGLIFGIFINVYKGYIWTHVISDTQRQRIECFQKQNKTEHDLSNCAFQLYQSQLAIGSGQLFGKGFGKGTQSSLDFLPDHNTDTIFATYSEEFGLVGNIMLLGLFVGLYYRIILIAEKVEDHFGFLLITGIITMLIFQTFANVAITIGLIPSTGIPMPLVSYGGSALWITLIMLGLVQSINRKSTEKKWISRDTL